LEIPKSASDLFPYISLHILTKTHLGDQIIMYDAYAKVVAQADARGEYLSAAQIDALSAAMVKDGLKRTDTVNRITSNASAIVANAARSLFAEQPQLIAPGGNAYTSRRQAACLRDMSIILRYVTYAIFTGDASVLEQYVTERSTLQKPLRIAKSRWPMQKIHVHLVHNP
jgi:hypothetical protein